jgi:hypothetical protein
VQRPLIYVNWHPDPHSLQSRTEPKRVSVRAGDSGLERFLAEQNIKRFKDQLDSCTDDRVRATLSQLLAEEEAKLNQLKPEQR